MGFNVVKEKRQGKELTDYEKTQLQKRNALA